jgi:hypothetical protein
MALQFSNCCGATLLYWPESDICPACREHCEPDDLTDHNVEADEMIEARIFQSFDPIADRLDNREEILFEREHHLNF